MSLQSFRTGPADDLVQLCGTTSAGKVMIKSGSCIPRVFHTEFNSLDPGRFEWNFRQVIFKLISVINGWGIFCEMIPRRMWLDLTDDKSTLVQVMAWCR